MQRHCSQSIPRVLWGLFSVALLTIGLSGCGGGDGNSAPASALAVGNWGGSQTSGNSWVVPATLTVTAAGGQMLIACQGVAQVSQPIVIDSNGHFSVTGTSIPCCTPVAVPTRFEGTLQNNILTLTLTNTQSGVALGTYTLRFGQNPPAQNFVCPG
jgi:hypothetical protein